MAVKKPGELAYWMQKHWHVIGELGEKYQGWYDVGRAVLMIATGKKMSPDDVTFDIKHDDKVYKTSIKDVPDWLSREIFRRIF